MAEIYAPRAARANEIGALSHNAAPAPFHAVASAAMPYVKIAPDRAQVSSEGELTYAIPAALRGKLEIGAAVLAPFGRQFVTGYVTGFTDSLDFDASRLKPISRLLKASLFDENALQVARWMSAYYHCALGECLACYVPSGARQDSEKRYAFAAQSFDEAARVLARSPRQKQIAQILFDAPKTLSQKEIEKSCGGDALPALRQLVTAQIVEETDELQNAAVKPRLVLAVQLTPEAIYAAAPPAKMGAAAPQQARALELLLGRYFQNAASTRTESPAEKAAQGSTENDQTKNGNAAVFSSNAGNDAGMESRDNSNEENASTRNGAPREYSQLDTEAPKHNAEENAPFPVAQAARDWNVDSAVWRALESKGYVALCKIEVQRAPQKELPPQDDGALIELTDEQKSAVEKIENALRVRFFPPLQQSKKTPHVVLLQGVTASGKTEVYLRAIEKCLALGKRALVLVPEIALTAQTVEIFQRRFQEKVAILHSALGAGERFDEWRRAHAGNADIVVGARSAVFAPCRDLGLIIIDEEHDGSYKQDSSPRYHARDVALRRAAVEGAVVVLGSATPSLESYQRATRGEYSHVVMKNRIAMRALPHVEIVDMTAEAKNGAMPVLSAKLKSELVETVGRGEQAILFLNRRGFASYVQCLGCGHVEKCPNCDVSLTYHRGEKSLRCHHCDHAARVLEECPECHGWMIGFTGTGTEKVESEVNALLAKHSLSDVGVLRLDRDTTSRKGSHAQILGEFRAGRARVLIGTQMVTKGLDFPNVTLVGVVNADSALNLPDFRAAERTFQLLAQVAGRAGRGEKAGRVLVQTLAAQHPVIEAARDQDFAAFVGPELEARAALPYPPFSSLANIVSQDEDEKIAKARLDELALLLMETIARQQGDGGGGTEILGPVDCSIARVKNKFRFHLLLRDKNRPRLHRALEAFDQLPRESRIGLTIDIDPMAML